MESVFLYLKATPLLLRYSISNLFIIIYIYDNNKVANTVNYYPTSLCRVQITPKTSTNITRYLYSRGPVWQVFSQRASDEFDSSYEKKFCLSIGISFQLFFLPEILK